MYEVGECYEFALFLDGPRLRGVVSAVREEADEITFRMDDDSIMMERLSNIYDPTYLPDGCA